MKQGQRVIYHFKGRATIKTIDGNIFPVNVTYSQTTNGAVLLACTTRQTNAVGQLLNAWEFESVTGTIKTGVSFQTVGPVYAVGSLLSHRPSGSLLKLTTWPARVEMKWQSNPVVTSYECDLVNFEFFGNESVTCTEAKPDGSTDTIHYWALSLQLPWGSFIIHPMPDYEERLKEVKSSHGVEVTARGVVTFSKEEEQSQVQRRLDEICRIISFSRGTKVDWVNLRGLSKDELSTLSLRNCVTRPFSPWPLIHPNHPEDTRIFVESAYPNYTRLRDLYHLDIACEMYLDAKNETTYLESRALNAVALLDMLQSQYAETNDLTNIVSSAKSFFDYLKPRLTEVLNVYPQISQEDRAEILSKLPELNRRSYLSVMKKWLTSLDVPYADPELSKIRDSRHSLAHRLQFCSTDSREKTREYMRILGLLHRALLRLLHYSGNYIDFDLDATKIKVAALK